VVLDEAVPEAGNKPGEGDELPDATNADLLAVMGQAREDRVDTASDHDLVGVGEAAASSRPMPEPPPVTRTLLSSSLIVALFPVSGSGSRTFRSTSPRERPPRCEYRLTEKDRDLPVPLLALMQWAIATSVTNRRASPRRRSDRSRVRAALVAGDDNTVNPAEVEIVAGPGLAAAKRWSTAGQLAALRAAANRG